MAQMQGVAGLAIMLGTQVEAQLLKRVEARFSYLGVASMGLTLEISFEDKGRESGYKGEACFPGFCIWPPILFMA